MTLKVISKILTFMQYLTGSQCSFTRVGVIMIELVDVENKSSNSVLYSLELLHNTLLRSQKAAEQTHVLLTMQQ